MQLGISTVGVACAVALAACTTNSTRDASADEGARELAEALQGLTPGAPVNCMPNLHGQGRMEVIDDNTILFREGATVYVQHPKGGCPGIDNGRYTLVLRQVGAHQICQGDIHQLIDLRNNVHGGSCVFGPFVPYRRAN